MKNNIVLYKKVLPALLVMALLFGISMVVFAADDPATQDNTDAATASVVKTWLTGECMATLYDDGTFVVEAKEGTAGETEQNYSGTNMPPWDDSQYVEQIKKAEVKEGVTSIGKQFFSGCVNLSSVDLPDSLTSIGQQAFRKNISLERIVIPKKVTSLPRYVFSDCEKLSEVVLQEGFLTLERQWVNYTCKSLTSLTLPASVNNLPMQSLSIPSLKDVYINSKAEDITIHNNVCSYNGQKVAFHVKCDQLEAFNTKYPEGTFQASNVTSATFVGDIHNFENGVCTNCGAPDPDAPAKPTFALTSSEGTDLKAKKNTTLTVDVTNGNVEDYTYKFLVYNKTTNQWYKLRDFDADNTFDWYTGPGGDKVLYADVQDAEGNLTRTALDVTITEPTLKVDKFTSSAGTELAVKSHSTLLAKASEGTAPYEYKFIVYNSTSGQWYKIQDFGEANTCDWYTGPVGTKTLYVDVKDADGTVVRAPLDVTVA